MSEKEKFTPEGEHSLLRPNRRTDLRLDLLVLEVKGVSESGVFFGYAKNLSGTGMFVATVNPRAVGENFTVSFTLPFEPFVAVSSLCRVAWTREFDPEKGG
ncbi:MAG: PilZ domain-containing protein, partial [Deltaproteobacteria bacterium]|nr:PilZ domain-containing protein [Deltaproteobacteria bacterium]